MVTIAHHRATSFNIGLKESIDKDKEKIAMTIEEVSMKDTYKIERLCFKKKQNIWFGVCAWVSLERGGGCSDLLPTGSEERGVLGVWSIPVAILPSCQYMNAYCMYS